MEGESEQTLMSRVQAGDREAYGRLVERFWAPLVVYAAGIVDRDDAEDVVQEVFIRLWRFRADWSASGSVKGYLYRITKNLALNAGRHERSEMKRRGDAGDRAPGSCEPSTPHQELEARLLREEVDSAIAALPSRRRDVFVLSRFHGLSYREIGEAMAISTQTVANQMSSALEELREALSAHLDVR